MELCKKCGGKGWITFEENGECSHCGGCSREGARRNTLASLGCTAANIHRRRQCDYCGPVAQQAQGDTNMGRGKSSRSFFFTYYVKSIII